MAHPSKFSFGDVVLVPFPFTDQSGTKKRPAAVISSHGYNISRRDIVIMAITSPEISRTPVEARTALPFECPFIEVSNLDERAGNAEANLYRRT